MAISITGKQSRRIERKMQFQVIRQALILYHNPFKAFTEVFRFMRLRDRVNGYKQIGKWVQSGSRYFWSAEYCGFPSENFNDLVRSEFPFDTQLSQNSHPLPIQKTLIWGITNRCPLSCLHCYEWDNLDKKELLDLPSLKKILGIFRSHGIRHLQFSGGEPLARFDDMLELLKEASKTMDCWILTSGFGMTATKATEIKKAGATGVHISLDHWDPFIHNQLRNNDKSWKEAVDAILLCRREDLIVSVSLCATKEFVNEENLLKFALFARECGADFIRILEPRAAGRLAGKDVHLGYEQIELISRFAIRMNSDPSFKDFPVINFLGYHQRQMPCFGAGNRFLYVDPGGDVHACPFCRGKMGNILSEPFTSILDRVKKAGCPFVSGN